MAHECENRRVMVDVCRRSCGRRGFVPAGVATGVPAGNRVILAPAPNHRHGPAPVEVADPGFRCVSDVSGDSGDSSFRRPRSRAIKALR